jgi:glycosyltransferase involved in cell wall biosynthesis
MFKYPKISIITPSYNQGHFIEQTIRSVLNQNYPNLEYIIIDGGSTDNTIEVIKKYQNKITYWISEPDKGQSDAINKGLKIASGDIINWLNSDDYYEPNTLDIICKAFIENTNTKVVCGRSRIFRNENETVFYSNGSDVYSNNLEKTIAWARIDQPETFFHKSAIEKMGMLDVNLKYLMDRDWWIKYLLIFGLDNIVKINDILVNFRLHNESKTISQGVHFQKEYDTWFYSFAKNQKLNKFESFIKSFVNVNENFEIENLPKVDLCQSIKILNYYLLLKANEEYELKNRKSTIGFLKMISFSELNLINKYLFLKLKILNFLYFKKYFK